MLFLFIAVVAIGCKKEEKIQKNLWNKDGVWNIDKFEMVPVTSNSTSTSYTNYGTLEFKENGTGYTKFTYQNSSEVVPMIYTLESDEILKLVLNGIAMSFQMEWSKDKMNLIGIDPADGYRYNFYLTKK